MNSFHLIIFILRHNGRDSVSSERIDTRKDLFRSRKNQPVIKATKKRWYILTIYILYSALSSLQWIQYSIIANLVTVYYNISAASVDLTSLIFMVMWPIMVFPASYIIDKTVSL